VCREKGLARGKPNTWGAQQDPLARPAASASYLLISWPRVINGICIKKESDIASVPDGPRQVRPAPDILFRLQHEAAIRIPTGLQDDDDDARGYGSRRSILPISSSFSFPSPLVDADGIDPKVGQFQLHTVLGDSHDLRAAMPLPSTRTTLPGLAVAAVLGTHKAKSQVDCGIFCYWIEYGRWNQREMKRAARRGERQIEDQGIKHIPRRIEVESKKLIL